MSAAARQINAPVLQLNFSYEPLETTSVKRAVRLVFQGKAEVLHDRHGLLLHSGTSRLTKEVLAIPLPSVIRMLYYVKAKRKHVPLTKRNVLYRDNLTCGYCGVKDAATRLAVDHVLPKSRGGRNTWENLVTACVPCNTRKRDRTPQEAGMKLLHQPHRPSYIPWLVVRKGTAPDDWGKFLSLWNISIGVEERPIPDSNR